MILKYITFNLKIINVAPWNNKKPWHYPQTASSLCHRQYVGTSLVLALAAVRLILSVFVCWCAEENKRVTRLCEVQDGSSSLSVCGLSLAPSSLKPLLRALKLQATLTEMHLSGNRLHDSLVPELIATAVTMPRLRLLDVSSNHITGEGLQKAVNALKGHSHPAFPVNILTSFYFFVISCVIFVIFICI